MARAKPDLRSHLVRQPGDSRTACGIRHEDVGTTWVRWMGAHETGRQFSGRPLPDWCNDCALALVA
jgi:hypothetical protein